MCSYTVIETDLGWVGLMRSEAGLCATTLPRPTPSLALEALDPGDSDLLVTEDEFQEAADEARLVVAGRRPKHEVVLDLSAGTPFQQAVWAAVQAIPYGQTRSYGWIAEAVGRPLAAHAVGQAVAKNRLPLFIPCHRVIAASGELGGYGSGHLALPTKRSLLRREGVHFDGPHLEQIRGTTGARA